MLKNIVVCLIWAKMLVLVANKVPFPLACEFHAIASIQTYSSKQIT
jgi:hypothetical protein